MLHRSDREITTIRIKHGLNVIEYMLRSISVKAIVEKDNYFDTSIEILEICRAILLKIEKITTRLAKPFKFFFLFFSLKSHEMIKK